MLTGVVKALETGAWLGAAAALLASAYNTGIQNIDLAKEIASLERATSTKHDYVTEIRRAEWYSVLATKGERCDGPVIIATVSDDCLRCRDMLTAASTVQQGAASAGCSEMWVVGLSGDTAALREMTSGLQEQGQRFQIKTPLDLPVFLMRSGLQALMVLVVDRADHILAIVRGMPVGDQLDQLAQRARQKTSVETLILDGLRNPVRASRAARVEQKE
jgi:hypothetical protein